jgi:hypothetical protein
MRAVAETRNRSPVLLLPAHRRVNDRYPGGLATRCRRKSVGIDRNWDILIQFNLPEWIAEGVADAFC